MKYKVTKTLQGKVVIDESDIEVNDFITDNYRIWEWLDDSSLLGRHKVLATINFSINKDVPMVVVEDEVERLAEKEYPLLNVPEGSGVDWHFRLGQREGLIKGFKAAKEGGIYSEEDLRDTISKSRKGMFLNEGHIKEYIDSLNQEYIELEMEIVNCYDDHGEGQISYRNYKEIIKTDTVDGQLMAYLKK